MLVQKCLVNTLVPGLRVFPDLSLGCKDCANTNASVFVPRFEFFSILPLHAVQFSRSCAQVSWLYMVLTYK